MRRDSKIVINTGRPGCGKSAAGFDLISSENHEPVGLDPWRLSGVFKTPIDPYDVAWENRAGFLGLITDDDHVIERLSNGGFRPNRSRWSYQNFS